MNKKTKQVLAIAAIVIIVALYIVTLFLGIFHNENTHQWFMACIIATVALPILIYIFIWLAGKVKSQKNENSSAGIPASDESDDDSDNNA